ncbi:MAG: NAD(P)-dependent oxidoreductase [Planctomycetes bacterium]|nr:NAD(P)-dependent oxidoreductase [Planctomycetota bacterium]
MKTLITGASGFLGSHLCERLLKHGAEVHAVSRTKRSSDHASVRWHQCPLTEFESVHRLFREIKPEVIFHLSGQVTAAAELELVLPTFNSLAGSTVHVLAAATHIGCQRVVLTGSLTEPDPTCGESAPSSPYAAAKWMGSVYARMFHRLYETPVVILRPFMTYGPRQNKDKLLPHVIRSLLRGSQPRLSSGNWQADWVYVDDVIDGFVSAASQPAVEGCTIDLGSGTLTSTREVVQKLVTAIDPRVEPLFGAVADRPFERVWAANTAYAKERLGWEPRTSLDQGLANTVRWFQENLKHSREGQRP